MSGAYFRGDEALQAPGKDGDEGNLDEGDEVFLRALEDGVQPPVAAQPGEGPLNHPADAGRNEASVAATGEAGQGSAGAAGGIARRGDRLDGDAERLAGLSQPLAPVAEIPQRGTLEASLGEFAQNREDAFGVMPVRRRNVDSQGNAVFVAWPKRLWSPRQRAMAARSASDNV